MNQLFKWNKRWRKKKLRIVNYDFWYKKFNPSEINSDWIVYLCHDEIETLRLKNICELNIIEWWKKMWVSKSTFANIYNNAIQKITYALINNMEIVISEVDYND